MKYSNYTLIIILLLWIVILNVKCNGGESKPIKKAGEEPALITPVQQNNEKMKFNDFSLSSLGKGINSATGFLGGFVVKKNKNAEYNVDSVNEINSETSIFSSLESFVESYSLNVDASLKYGAFQASLNLASSKNLVFNQYQQYIVFHAKTKKSHVSLSVINFDSSLISDSKNDPKGFLLTKGDMFLSGADIGGELFIIINIENTNRDEAEKSRIQVQESFNNLSVSQNAHADIRSCLEKIQHFSKTHINIIASGLDASKYNFANIESSTKFMEDYNKNISNGGTVLQFYPSRISDLNGCPSELKAQSNLMFINNKKSVLSKIDNLITQIINQQATLGYVLNDTPNFKVDIPLVRELNSLNNLNIITLRQNWNNCSVDTLNNDLYWEKSKSLAPRSFTPRFPPLFSESHALDINTKTQIIAIIPPNKTVRISLKGMIRFDSSLEKKDDFVYNPRSGLLDGSILGHGDFGGIPAVLIEIRQHEWDEENHKWSESTDIRELEPAGGIILPDGSKPNEFKTNNKSKMITARFHLMLVSNGWHTEYYNRLPSEEDVINNHVVIFPESLEKILIFVRE